MTETPTARPDAIAGPSIVLCDGAAYTLPAVKAVDFYFRRGADGKARLATGYNFDPSYDALVAAFADAEGFADTVEALFALAAHLLRLNYDLTDGQLGRLLRRYRPEDPRFAENERMWDAIALAAVGSDPAAPAPQAPAAATA